MLSKIQQVISEEMKAAETRIWAQLKPLIEGNGEDEFEGTFSYTANLFIPYEENIVFTHKSR